MNWLGATVQGNEDLKQMAMKNVAGIRLEAESLTVQKKLAAGSFGDVLKGTYQSTPVAIKVVHGNNMKDIMEEFGKEALIMADMRHPNVVLFIGIAYVTSANKYGIVLEYMERGSLFSILHKNFIPLSWLLKLQFAVDASIGMEYLHSRKPTPVVHADLKSHNLLVGSNWCVFIYLHKLPRHAHVAHYMM